MAAITPEHLLRVQSENILNLLFRHWGSRYEYTISFNSQNKNTVFFDTEWSRHPTPHAPTPDIRVLIHFAVSYRRLANSNDTYEDIEPTDDDWRPSKLPFPISKSHRGEPRITWRVQHEDFVHTSLENIDHHIRRVLKAKTLFFQTHSIDLEHKEALDSRLRYDSPMDSQPVLGASPDPNATGANEWGVNILGEPSSTGTITSSHGNAKRGGNTATSSISSSLSPSTVPGKSGGGKGSPDESTGLSLAASLSAIEQGIRQHLRVDGAGPNAQVSFSDFRRAVELTLASVASDVVLTDADFDHIIMSSGVDPTTAVSTLGRNHSTATSSSSTKYFPSSSSSSTPSSTSSPSLHGSESSSGDKVLLAPILSDTLQLIHVLRATVEAERTCVALEISAKQRAIYRVRASPTVHTAMDRPLLALDAHEVGKISPDAFIRFLGSLDLGLVESEIRAILELAPKSQPDGFILHVDFQSRYEQILHDALADQDLAKSRNQVGQYLLDVLRSRLADQGQVINIRGVVREVLPVDAVGYILAHDATRIRLSPLQIYGMLRGAGFFEADRALVDIARFSRLATLVVYRVYEQVLASSGIANPNDPTSLSKDSVLSSSSASSTSSSASKTKVLLEDVLQGLAPSTSSSSSDLTSSSSSSLSAAGAAKEAAEARFQQMIRIKFVEHDADDDNRLNSTEFAQCLSDFPIALSSEQIAQLRSVADADKDGFVSWPEFSLFASTTLASILTAYIDRQKKEQSVLPSSSSGINQSPPSNPLTTGAGR